MKIRWSIIACALAGSLHSYASFNVIFNPIGSLAEMSSEDAAPILSGFGQAAAKWSSSISNDVTIRIDVDYAPIGDRVLGGASSTFGTVGYDPFIAAWQNRSSSTYDALAGDHLNSGSAMSPYINRTADNPNGFGSATPYVDLDGSLNNSTIRMTTANARALGLLGADDMISDATIQFTDFSDHSANYSWSFDSQNVGSTQIDFVSTATHEIGHVLGFTSGVDILDINSPPNGGPYSADQFQFVTPLDLFRHSDDSIAAGADLDWTADERLKYFSLDGESALAEFATGMNFGDGNQASHWKDEQGNGLMDPTISGGEVVEISALDLIAMDVIGWDVEGLDPLAVPEPLTSSVYAGLAAMACLLIRRRAGCQQS